MPDHVTSCQYNRCESLSSHTVEHEGESGNGFGRLRKWGYCTEHVAGAVERIIRLTNPEKITVALVRYE